VTAPPKQKRATRAQLEGCVRALEEEAAAARGLREQMRTKEGELRSELKRQAGEIDDLKIRLAQSESENQRMRGYIERVQEDDVVREELVVTGEPGGQQQLVPKRRSTAFVQPGAYSYVAEDGAGCTIAAGRVARGNPRHWVTYGGTR
jgi:hypothetical protein